MKKIYYIITISVLMFSTVNAQILSNGNIRADLLNTNYFLDASNFQGVADASNGKLLGFPKTDLTQFKFNLAVVTDDVVLSGFDGVIVYNSATGKTGEDAATQGKQVEVTPGFYYFSNPEGATTQSVENGKWIRLSDNFANKQEWVYNPTNEQIELERSGKNDFKNKVWYTKEGRFINSESMSTYLSNGKGVSIVPITSDNSNSFNVNMIKLSSIPYGNTNSYFYSALSTNILDLNTDGINKITGSLSGVATTKYMAQILPNTQGYLYGVNGAHFYAVNRSEQITLRNMIGSLSTSNLYAGNVVNSMVGAYGSNNIYTNGKVYDAFGVRGFNSIGKETNPTINLAAGSYMYNFFRQGGSSTVKKAIGILVTNTFEKDSTNSSPSHTANIDNLYGVFINPIFGNIGSSVIKNEYGFFISDVNQGQEKNYAIYTGLGKIRFGDNVGVGVDNPTAKLEVNGTIKATKINFTGLPTYANDAAAANGGLQKGDCYKTATGELRIKL